MMLALFTVTSFAAATLLFMVQPMIAKMALPTFGGSPSVWNTAVVFFQATLLAGYLYSHLSTTRLGRDSQRLVHISVLLLPLVVLPFALPQWSDPATHSSTGLWLLLVLLAMVGAPFFAVSTSGPLLQRWFSLTDHARAGDPYFLYAASNAGSVVGLLGYLLIVEPRFALATQADIWMGGYAAFALLTIGCAIASRPKQSARATTDVPEDATASAVGWSVRVKWLALAFVPSSLMLGVTTYTTTDVAAVPLLWVLPLSVYLLTFVIAFARPRDERMHRAWNYVATALVVIAGLELMRALRLPTVGAVALHLLTFGLLSLILHRRLASDRPATGRLTEFYLLVSVGGVLGGAFNALVAPLVFDSLVEYPLVLAAAIAVVTPRFGRAMRTTGARVEAWAPIVLLVVGALVAFGPTSIIPLALFAGVAGALIRLTRGAAPAAIGVIALLAAPVVALDEPLFRDRSFFGVNRVLAEGNKHVLVHGSTEHGAQDMRPGRRDNPLLYYERKGPAGDAFKYLASDDTRNIAVIGMGSGALAAYGRTGDQFDFYEIDEQVIRIARDPDLFTYLRDTKAEVRAILGDGRLEIAKAPAHSYDMIVLDAFSSDSIPVHLLTTEAVEIYIDKLAPDGILLVHISNNYLDLEPVAAGMAESQRLTGYVRVDTISDWVVLSPDVRALTKFESDERWRPLDTNPTISWRDDFSNILQVLR